MSVVHLPPRGKHATLKAALGPVVRLMRYPGWPSVCGRNGCAHQLCMRVRQDYQRRTCTLCTSEIKVGQRYVERDGGLLHETCAKAGEQE